MHLLALGIGLGAVFARGRALSRISQEGAIASALIADSFWGLSALLWIPTGLVRAFGGFEKGTAYYLDSTVFWIKMALLAVILVLEIRPIIILTRWRLQQRRGVAVDTSAAGGLARGSYAQVAVIIVMVLAATAMARGIDL